MNPDLEAAFANGTLVRPSPEEPSLVHLVRALATLGGVPDLDGSRATGRLLDVIAGDVARPPEHLVFILLDGLGMNVLQRLPAGSFIASHFRTKIHATCPSTTACALTSVATGQWPAQHAVTGWFTHLPEFSLTCMPLPFQERFSKRPLAQQGVGADQVLPLKAFYRRMTHGPVTLLPAQIVNTTYATWSRGATAGMGYLSAAHAVDQMIQHIRTAAGPTYTHLYIPDIDTRCHKASVQDASVLSLVLEIDGQIQRLADELKGRARLIVSADHGLIDVPKPDQSLLRQGDPLLELLQNPPSGDARLPMFHLREGREEAFVSLFRERFAQDMILLSVDEIEQLQLFGPGPMCPASRSRFGQFIGVSRRPATISYQSPNDPVVRPYIGQHAGLSPDEMLIPLCVA